MSSLIERRANELGFAFELTRPVFSLAHESRGVFDALIGQTPQVLEAFESLEMRFPLPKSAVASVESHFYRLANHNRSFCYALADSGAFIDAPVLVFKGSEPLLPDFPTMLDWMLQAPLRRSSRVMADHFPLAEGKIPGALSLKEANREAEIALDVQKRHLLHYGALARIPVPLLIHAIPAQATDACAQTLRGKLSSSAYERIEPLLQSGLAVYIYYYPSAPIRSNYWGDMAVPELRRYIDRALNEEATITGWVNLIVRIMYLGYLPYTVRNEGLGACMDFGNAALDGGFCDPDSIVTIEDGTDDEFYLESMIQSLMILQNTVGKLLGLSDATVIYPSIERFVCAQYIDKLLRNAINSEARAGLHLDERFLALLSPSSPAEVKACARRKNRIPLYTYFARRSCNL